MGAGAFFCFFVEGGVLDRSESSFSESSFTSEFSSSESAFARFFGFDVVFGAVFVVFVRVVCFVAFGFGAAAFFTAAFGFW